MELMTHRENGVAQTLKDEDWRHEVIQRILLNGLHTDCHEFLGFSLSAW